MDSSTLNRSFTFLILMSELCMSKRGKKSTLILWELQCVSYYLFPLLQSKDKLGGLIFTGSGLQKKYHYFNGNQMSNHNINDIMRHRTNAEMLNAWVKLIRMGTDSGVLEHWGFCTLKILLQTFPSAVNAGSPPLEVALEGIWLLLLLLA